MKSRILILSHEYPPYSIGGVATFTKELAEYLYRHGYDVYVVAGRNQQGMVVERHIINFIYNFCNIIRWNACSIDFYYNFIPLCFL
ncbi:MAG: glycogen/starch synthase, partial [Infirmifilum sp.]